MISALICRFCRLPDNGYTHFALSVLIHSLVANQYKKLIFIEKQVTGIN
jgi:hypothetical protein